MESTNLNNSRSAILLIQCPLGKRLASSVTDFVYNNKGNILYHDQYVDTQKQLYFTRIEWSLEEFSMPAEEIGRQFQKTIAEKFDMQWTLHFSDDIHRMAVFVSKLPHCFYEILSHFQSEEWQVHIPLIISNHPELEPIAKRFGIDFHHVPVTQENKQAQEHRQLELLKEYNIDLIVLARYMQIVSENFVAQYPNRIINIHHSFLPAFVGAKPYHAAYARGVKIIGATSHYVTGELDAGPIIEQDVVRINHKDPVESLIRKGRELEKTVLARAIRYHIQRKILVYDRRTVIFFD